MNEGTAINLQSGGVGKWGIKGDQIPTRSFVPSANPFAAISCTFSPVVLIVKVFVYYAQILEVN